MGKFSDQVDEFARTYKKRLRAAGRAAVQDTIKMAQKTRGDGGRMPVVTGFLRASIQGALVRMPDGPTTNVGNATHPLGSQVAGEPVVVTLVKWDPNLSVPLFIGWTAVYARHREAQDGFLQGAVEKWDQTIRRAANKVRIGL